MGCLGMEFGSVFRDIVMSGSVTLWMMMPFMDDGLLIHYEVGLQCF